jgi:SAM-dependent methyltransferase
VLRGLVNKVGKSLKRRGLLGTLGQVVKAGTDAVRDLSPARRRGRRQAVGREQAFDREFGVDTAGLVRLSDLRIQSGNWVYGHEYQGIDPSALRKMLRELDIRHEDFTFVDFGSGKGRALLLAAEFPFRKIIGVEFAPALHEAARENLRVCRKDRLRCHDIELVCQDAVTYPIPDGPAVFYFYNPFVREVMAKVVHNIRAALERRPRDAVVLYYAPEFDDLWQQVPGLRKVRSAPGYSTYRTEPVPEAGAMQAAGGAARSGHGL